MGDFVVSSKRYMLFLSMTMKWIFFDIGGVLLDETPLQEWKLKTILRIVRERDDRVAIEDIVRVWPEASRRSGNLAANVIRLLLPDTSMNKKAIKEMEDCKDEMEHASDLQEVRPEARAVLENLSQKFHLGIMANQPQKVKKKFIKAGILPLFFDKTVSGEVKYQKPDIAFFRDILARVGAKAEESILVDDNVERGLMPAKSIGMQTVWYRISERKNPPKGVIDRVITNLLQLVDAMRD